MSNDGRRTTGEHLPPPSTDGGRSTTQRLQPATPRATGGGEGAIHGAVIAGARDVLIETLGREAFDGALATLPRDVANRYVHATSVEWVPVSVVVAVAEACGRWVGRDPMTFNDEITKVCVARSFRTIWRVFFRFTSDEALLSRAPVVFAKTYDRGRITIAFEHRLARVELVDWPDPPLLVLRSFAVGIEQLLTLSGRENVRVTFERRPGKGAMYTATWSSS